MNLAFSEILVNSFSQLGQGAALFIPKLLAALIIALAGWWIAVAVGNLVAKVINAFKLDRVFQSLGLEDVLSKGGFTLNTGAFVGALVKWFIIIVSLVASMDVVGLAKVNDFLLEIVAYLPNVFVAALILAVAAFVADAVRRIVIGSAKAANVPSSNLMGGIVKWAIWIFAVLAALYQLGIAGVFAQTIFTGVIAMLTIAGGLAFGLGGKDAAARYIEQLRRDINQ